MSLYPLQNIIPKIDGDLPKGFIELEGKIVPAFPFGDFSTGKKLLTALGSFWANQFTGKGKLLSLFKGSAFTYAQTFINWLETLDATSRYTVPIFHKKTWGIFVLRESEFDSGRASLYKFDGELTFDGTFKFGQRADNDLFENSLSSAKHIGIIFNRILNPSIALIQGQDFIIEDGVLLLKLNPFEDPRFSVRLIYDSNGAVIDREVILWGFEVKEDQEFLYEHFGYVLNKKAKSSQGYKDLINSIWNSLVGGLTIRDLEWALAAIFQLPVVIEQTEKVEKILNYPDQKLVIITDQNSYIYPAGSIPIVSEGDTVFSGQLLIDTVQVYDLTDYENVSNLLTAEFIDDFGNTIAKPSRLSSSAISASIQSFKDYSQILPPSDVEPKFQFLPLFNSLVNNNLSGPLIFRNSRSALVAVTTSNGDLVTQINDVLGAEQDLETFWQKVFDNGQAGNKQWINYYPSVPDYINPAGWLIENFLKNNSLIIKIRFSKIKEFLGLDFLALLRLVLPAEKFIIVLLDVEIRDDESFDETQACVYGSSSFGGDACEFSGVYSVTNENNISIDDGSPVIYYTSNCLG